MIRFRCCLIRGCGRGSRRSTRSIGPHWPRRSPAMSARISCIACGERAGGTRGLHCRRRHAGAARAVRPGACGRDCAGRHDHHGVRRAASADCTAATGGGDPAAGRRAADRGRISRRRWQNAGPAPRHSCAAGGRRSARWSGSTGCCLLRRLREDDAGLRYPSSDVFSFASNMEQSARTRSTVYTVPVQIQTAYQCTIRGAGRAAHLPEPARVQHSD